MSTKRPQRRLLAILAGDMVGYSRLMELDEEGTLARLKEHRRVTIDPMIAAQGGRIIKTTGDGMLVEFPGVVDAVECAVTIQERISDVEGREPNSEKIAFRIGINIGDVIIDGDDIYGDGVNIAARLEGIAQPGGICLSSAAYETLRGKTDLAFDELGHQRLKNIARSINVWRWRKSPTASLSARSQPALVSPPDRPSVAVLPFENISGDPDQEYFVDGVTDDITTALSKLPWLFVISRDTTFTYKDRAVDIKQVGQELGVRYVLAGSLRKAADRLRLNTRLMDAATGSQVWADRYDGRVENVFDFQDEITSTVVSTLAPEITSAEIERSRKKRPESLDAWDYYLRSLPFSYEVTKEGFDEANRLLEASIDKDPKFSTAYARLGVNHFYAAFHGWIGGARDTAERGRAYAKRAVELDPLNPFAHEAMGAAHIFSDRRQVISSSQRALSLDPNLSMAFAALSSGLAFMGRAEEAIEAFKRAERCSPRDPMRWFRLCGLFNAYFKLEDYEASIAVCREVSQIKPMWYGGYAIEAASFGLLGREEEAARAIDGLLNASPRFSVEGAARNQLWDDEDGAARVIDGLRKAGLREKLE